ncbi:penicillin-binding protein [Bacillus suaedaesalsae]|uniref:serine-type D-Ala-D-Ala carboxypeptidase n=1 Tax=Bacillus suaedaesalsae TaxID=2810349 RepID=A0ABS2DJH1_9BACI|nr:penicillin-binding protein [Bacillus suaedaesalsae]MBM6618552.1 penicillin-binding protein [Bacillus suaedaesalsae]
MKTKSTNINKGAAAFTILFAGLFFLFMARFLYIQVTGTVEGKELPVMAEEKYSRTQTVDADRGNILDRNGIPIAKDTPAYTIEAILSPKASKDSPKDKPRHVVDPEQTAEKLAPILGMEYEDLYQLFVKRIEEDRYQIELGSKGRGLSYQKMQEISELKLPGITFKEETIRYYPNGMFATHVIGFARKGEDGKVKGLQGLEKTLDKYLVEENGQITKKSDRNGISLLFQEDEVIQPKNGANVYLTIDQKIQAFLEDSMSKVMKEYEPENIVGIVADPKTGAILAMSSRPTYNPNDIPSGAYMLNDAIGLQYEPGSTMKIFTLATAIEEGVFNPNETYKSGSYRVLDRTIRDHFRGGWGTISYLEGFQRSSNVAMAKLVMEKMNGDDRLLNYLQAFGFGQPTEIDLTGEASGHILYNWPIEKVTTSFGQGSTVTPIQQIQAATAIANGGKMMKPFIVDKIEDPTTKELIENRKPTVVGTPISEQTAKQVMDILETVVSSEKGTGKPYRIEGYKIAGKTGTAQIPDGKGGWLNGHGENVFSFLGMAPKDNPELIVYISVTRPKLTLHESGSQPVSAIFNSVVKNSLQYLNIKPTISDEEVKQVQKKKQVGFKLDSYEGRNVATVTEELTQKGANVIVIGDGTKIVDQAPYANAQVLSGERVLLRTDGKHAMPDITTWSLRDVMKLSDLFGLNVNTVGHGYVKKQNIAANSSLKDGDQLVIELAVPNSPEEEIVEQADSDSNTEEPLD